MKLIIRDPISVATKDMVMFQGSDRPWVTDGAMELNSHNAVDFDLADHINWKCKARTSNTGHLSAERGVPQGDLSSFWLQAEDEILLDFVPHH